MERELWPGCEAYLRELTPIWRRTRDGWIEVETKHVRQLADSTEWARQWDETRRRETAERRDWE